MTGISKIAWSFCVLLALQCPAAVYAFSYDEIVLIVQAEERAFGKGNYEDSFDQRLATLENTVFGHSQQGSDSFRLRAVCRALGLEKPAGSVMAAPFSVEISPARAESSQKAAKPVEKSAELPAALKTDAENSVEKASGEKPSSEETTVLSNSLEQPAPVRLAEKGSPKVQPKPKSEDSKELVKQGNADADAFQAKDKLSSAKAAVPPAEFGQPIGKDAIQEQAAVIAAPAAGTAAASATGSGSNPGLAETPAASIGVALFGLLAIFTGLALFFFLRNKEEVSLPFAGKHAYEYEECEELYDEQDQQNECLSLPVPVAVAVPVVFAELAAVAEPNAIAEQIEFAKSFALVGETASTVPAEFNTEDSVSLPPAAAEMAAAVERHAKGKHAADTVHVAEFTVDWECRLSANNVCEAEATAAPTFHFPVAAELSTETQKEFSKMLDSMSREEIEQMLEDFTPSMVAMDTAQEFHLLNASSEDLLAEYKDVMPALLSLNVADFLNQDASREAGTEQDDRPVEWPAFEPVVAPKITTVNAFLKDTLRTASEMIGYADDPTEEREQLMPYYSDPELQYAPEMPYSEYSVPADVHDCSVPVDLHNEDSEGACYRALAQVLIEAANQASFPQKPQTSALIPSVPISGRRIMVAQLTGRKGSAEFEDSLRSLFSEKC